jgi:hypothetical protein
MKKASSFSGRSGIRYGALRRFLAVAASAAIVAGVSSASAWAQATASQTPTPKPSKVAKKQTAKREQMVFTGSLIKRDVPRHGLIAVTDSPLVVIDQKQIEQSGASTLVGVLKRYGTYR